MKTLINSKALTVQKGKPTVLICVDGELQRKIESETEGNRFYLII